jgi:cytochrome c peroxidase
MNRSTVAVLLVAVASLACDESSKGTTPSPAASGSAAPAASASAAAAPEVKLPPAAPLPSAPLGLPTEMTTPGDNPMTPEKVALGAELFFDKRTSKDGTFSCETCHVHEKGWTDGLAFSKKADGSLNTRSSPTLYNVGYYSSWYWDGRATTLEKQVVAAWKGQMGTEDQAAIAKKLAEIPAYKAEFERAFHAAPSAENIVNALACFVRTLRSGDSAWDKHEKGDKDAVDAEVLAGQALFTGKAKCALCHAPPTYFDTLFHNVGVGYGNDSGPPDVGRFKVSNDVKDTGAFKTPGLRSVSKTGPYFHDGSAATLEDAVKFMLAGGKKNEHTDPKLTPVKLSEKEVGQLVAFIKSLDSTESFEKPKLP